MPRRREPLRFIERYEPDLPRCAQALLRLLSWEPSKSKTISDADGTPPDASADRHEDREAQAP